jgi:hypothetical protein
MIAAMPSMSILPIAPPSIAAGRTMPETRGLVMAFRVGRRRGLRRLLAFGLLG